MLAREIMTTEVITVGPEDSVETVIKLLVEHKISGVPVINEDREVLGIVSEGDLLVRNQKLHVPSYIQILGGIIYLDDPEEFKEDLKKAVAFKAGDVMTESPLTVDEDTQVEELATIMSDAGVNRLPVIRDGKLAGIVSRADIIKSMAQKGSSNGVEG